MSSTGASSTRSTRSCGEISPNLASTYGRGTVEHLFFILFPKPSHTVSLRLSSRKAMVK